MFNPDSSACEVCSARFACAEMTLEILELTLAEELAEILKQLDETDPELDEMQQYFSDEGIEVVRITPLGLEALKDDDDHPDEPPEPEFPFDPPEGVEVYTMDEFLEMATKDLDWN